MRPDAAPLRWHLQVADGRLRVAQGRLVHRRLAQGRRSQPAIALWRHGGTNRRRTERRAIGGRGSVDAAPSLGSEVRAGAAAPPPLHCEGRRLLQSLLHRRPVDQGFDHRQPLRLLRGVRLERRVGLRRAWRHGEVGLHVDWRHGAAARGVAEQRGGPRPGMRELEACRWSSLAGLRDVVEVLVEAGRPSR